MKGSKKKSRRSKASASSKKIGPIPKPVFLPENSSKHYLYENIRRALRALPPYFRPEISISGVLATDIFALNSSLGSTIEEKTVDALNQVRTLWDPQNRYPRHSFIRQTQTFPDVILAEHHADGDRSIAIGLELKGWYILSKEEEPSLRFTASYNACGKEDLFVVFPWVLSSVISGSPKLFRPFIAPSRYIAEMRNHYWRYSEDMRQANRKVVLAKGAHHYPKKSDKISDRAAVDSGGNFGRIARTGALGDYVPEIMSHPLCGIPAYYWCRFFGIFTEGLSSQRLTDKMETYTKRWAARIEHLETTDVKQVQELLTQVATLLEPKA